MAWTKLLDESWLEPIALVHASRRARGLSGAARQRMEPWARAARGRFRVARELRDVETQVVALALLKEAAFFALCALASVEPSSLPRTSAEAWARFDPRGQEPAGEPAGLALVQSTFSDEDPLALDRVARAQANELRLAAEAVLPWLLRLVEVRTPAQLARTRVVRATLALVLVIVLGVGLISYALSLAALDPS